MKFKEMNLPNKLTTIRMFCVPFMVVLFLLMMLHQTFDLPVDYYVINDITISLNIKLSVCQIIMVVLFAFASITDFVDGHLARKYNLVSDYGKLMDPLADKLLVNTTIICMMVSGMYLAQPGAEILAIVSIFCSILVIARDIFVDALRMQALKKNAVVAASIWGKLKTATLMPGIIFMLLGSLNIVVYLIGISLMAIGGIFALIGGIKYFISLSKYIES